MEFQIDGNNVGTLSFNKTSSTSGSWSLTMSDGTHQPIVNGADGTWSITLSGEDVSSTLSPELAVGTRSYTQLLGKATFNSNNQIDGGSGTLQYDGNPTAGDDTWRASASMGEEHHHRHHGHRHDEAKA
jgi:predicted secreted protein